MLYKCIILINKQGSKTLQASVIVYDEVNCKIDGLELKTRKRLVEKFKFEIPGVRYTPAVRLGRWDGKVSFFQLSGTTYINLLPEILPIIAEEGYDIHLRDLRTYVTNFQFDEFRQDTFANSVWPVGHVAEGQPIKFRDYQVEIINNFLSNPQSVQIVATGAGKTIMTAALSKSVEKYGRSIVIVPNKSLVTQTEADYINLGLNVGVFFGDRKEFGRTHTICTWQSLNNLMKGSKEGEADIPIGEFIDGVICVMVDEVHVAKAEALKSLLSTIFPRVPIRWGLTGTLPKEDYAKHSIFCSIGQVVGQLSAAELQESGHLANCHVNIVQLMDHREYKDYQSELRFLTEDAGRLDYIASMITKIKNQGNTLVLIDRIATGNALIERLPDAVFVSGSTKAKDRKAEYDEIAVSDDKVIVATYGVAAVGINIPRIFNLVLVEPGKSFVRVIQSIGRGIRKAADKDNVLIWDITSNCKFAKRHLAERKKYYTEAQYPYTIEKADWQ